MKIRLKVLLFILFFVVLYAAYYWGVPAVFDIRNKTYIVKNIIKKELGAEIEIKDPELKMGLLPSVWLNASYFEIIDKKSSPFFVENPKLKIKLIPLLFGKVHLGYFSCDKINANLKIDKNYRFYIGNYMIIKTSDSRISIENSKMNIGGYNIKLKDESQNKNIIAKGDYFTLKKYDPKKYIKFSTNSKIKINNRYSVINTDIDFKLPFKKGFDTNKIAFNGTITNLNLSDLSPYIKKLSNNKIKQITGILNIEADTKILNRKKSRISTQMAIKDFSILTKNQQKSLYFKNKLNVDTVIDVSKNIMTIKKFKILSGKINANIEGKINKISYKNPLVDLSIIINKSGRIEDFISILPDFNIKNIDINIPALKKYGYYSDIEGKIFIKGRADKPKITGKILSKNGYLMKPLNAPGATLKTNFLGENFYLDLTVPVGNDEKFFIKGSIGLYGKKNINLNITSTQNINLETTEFVLNALHEIFYFNLGPLPVMKLKGLGNIDLKITGRKNNPHIWGAFNFKNTTGSFNNINATLENIEGSLYFKDQDTHFITRKAFLYGKPIKIDGKCTLFGTLDYDVTSNGQDFNKMLNLLSNSPMLSDIQKSVSSIKNADGKLDIKLKLKGQAKGIEEFGLGETIAVSGNLKLLGNTISIGGLQIPIKNLFGSINFKNADADFDLYSLVNKSKIHIEGKVKDKVLYSKVKLDDIAFLYSDIPVKIFSGNIEINDDKLILYKVNGVLDSMPILIDGFVTNIFKTPALDLYINSKPTQKFIDIYINKNSIYPLKIKGDVMYSARLSGTKESLNAKTEINLQKDSSIYYMGATIGDVNSPVRIFFDANISKNSAKNSIYINSLQYDKLISSQNNKEFVSQQLNAKGQIDIDKNNNILFHNFKVRTQNPTDAKIFNILFKKPLIKQGQFSSNVIINGLVSYPKLLGSLNFTGINIPLLDTIIKDISLEFKDKNINIKSKGEVFSNPITLFSNMENKLKPPYVFNKIDIYLGNFDIDELIEKLNILALETNVTILTEQKSTIDIKDLVIKSGKIKAESVFVKNLFAKDFTADFSLNENLLFSLDNFNFNVAQGLITGDFKYNLLNSKSDLSLNVKEVNANSMAEALFNLKNQIFGLLTGQVDFTCNGRTHKTCMETLSGKGGFSVKDGKMPKLGSLEYLLKAGNLVKSGVTGLTINSIIDLVTPLKTGQFENINGMFTIKSGLADPIQIFSKGKDLSLFLTGTYNLSTFIADMKIFGRISKKISNLLGPVGNASLNTLFNTIPGLNLDETNKKEFINNFNKIPGFELNDKTHRNFSVDIYGDINGDNYVKSFKWVD